MGLNTLRCCTAPSTDAESSGTLIGAAYTVPAGARSVTLTQHSNGGIVVSGEVNATFTWAGSSRTWNANETAGTDGSYAQGFIFTPTTANTVYEVNWQI